MRSKFHHDLAESGRVNKPVRSKHNLVKRSIGGETGKDNIGLCRNILWRFHRNAANFFKIGKRATTIAKHPVAALDQMLADRKPDLADADKADCVHDSLDWFHSRRCPIYVISMERSE